MIDANTPQSTEANAPKSMKFDNNLNTMRQRNSSADNLLDAGLKVKDS